jgi:chromosome segregation ATPase
MGINQEFEKSNEDQLELNKSLNQKILKMKEERNSCELECERLRKLLEDSINTLKNLEKEARNLESSNHRHETILQIAMADREEVPGSISLVVRGPEIEVVAGPKHQPQVVGASKGERRPQRQNRQALKIVSPIRVVAETD